MAAEQAVRRIVEDQAAAWNAGDLEGFLQHVHDDVVYVTPAGLVRGREALLEAYRGDWRDRPGGRLTVAVEQVLDHGTAATAIVRYWLSASREDRSGWSLLTFVHADGDWRLIADASMRSR